MFEAKKSILFITKQKIKIVNVSTGGGEKENIVAFLDWTPDTLSEILLKNKKSIKDPARILLSEDFVYTVNLSMPSGSFSRDDIKRKAQELIPENLEEGIWDFRKIGVLGKIQVIALARALFGTVSSAIAKAGIRIEAIESLSLALARFAQKEDNPVVFVYINETDILVCLTQKGTVLATEMIKELNTGPITKFIKFARDQYGIEVKDIILCGNTKNLDPSQAKPDQDDIRVKIQNISPVVNLANKEDLKGKDEEVLNIELLKPSSFFGTARSEPGSEPPSQHLELRPKTGSMWKGMIIAFITFIIIIILVFAGFLFFQSEQKPDQNIIKPTSRGAGSCLAKPDLAQQDFAGQNCSYAAHASIFGGSAGQIEIYPLTNNWEFV